MTSKASDLSLAGVKSRLDRLDGLRVYFGHQSVGANILEGLRHLGVELGLPVTLAEPGFAARDRGLHLTHSLIGTNTDPVSKLTDFGEAASRLGGDVDVAMMKFCYADIRAGTDVDDVFRRYCATVETVVRAHPELTIAHITAPLTSRSTGIRSRLRALKGRPNASDDDNLQRERYNDLVRTYFAKEPIFDLADIEAEAPGGRHRDRHGELRRQLAPELTDDGGHLNDAGRRAAATALLACLSLTP
jgi:hypothetical protein